MKNRQTLYNVLLSECKEDYVGLWSVIFTTKKIINTGDTAFLKQEVLYVLHALMEEGNVVAGTFVDGKFQVWEDPNKLILSKISYEWQQMNREPSIGEIVWFTIKEGSKDRPGNKFFVGDRVSVQASKDSEKEYGIVVHFWYDSRMQVFDYYVAFFWPIISRGETRTDSLHTKVL